MKKNKPVDGSETADGVVPQRRLRGALQRVAWLPVPLLLTAILAARAAGLSESYENDSLRLVLSFTFYTLVSLGTLFLIGRSFLTSGSPGLLLLECGVVLWSLAGTVGDFVDRGDANINVTIFNTGILLAGLCHLAGAILSLQPQRSLRAKPLWLGAGCAFALAALGLITWAALAHWLPVFFIPGQGGTTVRYCVLVSATAMFVLSAVLLHAGQRAASHPFTSWYSLALLLLAVGLFGIMIQLSLWSVVNWLGRTAQWLGGFYLLLAAIAALSESNLPLLPLGEKLRPALYRDAMAVVMVLAAASLRLVFLSGLGTHAPFVVFYPAVIFAALYGGRRAGLLATALSAILADYFWIEPASQFGLTQPADWLGLVTFLLSGTMIAWVTESLLRARARASAAEAQALLAAEREAAARVVRESRAKLEAALASMTDAVFISDAEGRFIEFNDAFATFHRFRTKDECAKTFADYPELLDVFMANGELAPLDQWAVPRALRGETVTNAEYTLRRKDTGETWVGSYSFAPIRDKDGKIVGSVVTARDITDGKRADEALRESERLMQAIIDGSTSPIFLKDRDGKFITINASLERMLGISREEIKGKTDYDIAPKEVAEHWRTHDTKVMATGKAIQIEEVADLQDGHHIFLANKFPLVDADGQVCGIGAISHDITERKRAEEALRKSEQEFRSLAEAVPQIVWATRPDGWNIYFNQQWMDYTGLTLDESYGHGWNTPFHPDDKQRAWDAWQRATQHNETYLLECRLRRADGVYRWWLIHGAPVRDANGEIQKWLGTCTDIEEFKQAEEALQQAKAAAEAANMAKSQFLANMSHELRTPMNAILGMIDVALPKAIDPTVKDCLQTAKGSADLLLTLLDDLLDSAKIESGKLELEAAPFSLRRMLDQMTRVLSVRASEKGLCFYCRMPDETPDAVVGDRMRLQQVLLNLAGNAIKFTERGDVEISLHVSPRPLAGEGPGVRATGGSPHPSPLPEGEGTVHLEFAVRDTGIGIPPSGAARLFQPFAQADPSMARRFGGTGLGLSICKSLVEMMGGRIWVDSEVGKGSTFRFTVRLPLATEPPAGYDAPVVTPAAVCAQLRILLVEDNPANQKLATYILQDRGHLVEIAGDGQEAIYLAEQNSYDVILMDVQMPGMNGLEATAAIRKREDGSSRVPIVAMTAHAMRGDREHCLAAGMDGYLSKPINAQEMIGLVESLAQGVTSVAHLAAATLNPAETSSQTTAVIFNPEEAISRCFNSRDMVREMIQCFFDEVDNVFPQMRAALEKGELVEVGRLGHRMKGTVVYLGAQAAKEAALCVERFCNSSLGTPSEARQAINALERECLMLKAALSEHPLAAESKESN